MTVLIAGLGNPGDSYRRTRHNIGQYVVEKLAAQNQFPAFKKGFNGRFSKAALFSQASGAGHPVMLLIPETYMNLSGRSIQPALSYYRLKLDQLLVIQDELALPFGRMRLKKGGGAAGHNGIRSIDQAIGPDYWRLRIGINHPGPKDQVHPHVLGNFTPEETDGVEHITDYILEHISAFVAQEYERFQDIIGAFRLDSS